MCGRAVARCEFLYLRLGILYSEMCCVIVSADDRRFLLTPPQELKDRLQAQEKRLKEDADNLGKKLHYLETTAKNSREHIEQLLRHGGGG